jgi:hypothetical protein
MNGAQHGNTYDRIRQDDACQGFGWESVAD